MEYQSCVIISNNSDNVLAGFGCDSEPRTSTPRIVGYPKVTGNCLDVRRTYVGDLALTKRNSLIVRYPLSEDLPTDLNAVSTLWHYVFYNELRVAPEEQPVIMDFPPYISNEQKERIVQIMFETLNVPYLFLKCSPVLALLSSGRRTGVVVHSNFRDTTYVAPVCEGQVVQNATLKINVAGGDLVEFMRKLLVERNDHYRDVPYEVALWSATERVRTSEIVDKLCVVALDFRHALALPVNSKFKLPDGNVIELSNERFICPEALFNPSLIGFEATGDDDASLGLHQAVFSSIMKCDAHMRPELFKNIVLSGKAMKIQFVDHRLEVELLKLVKGRMFVNVAKEDNIDILSWRGASVLSYTLRAEDYISRAEYDDHGPCAVHAKLPMCRRTS